MWSKFIRNTGAGLLTVAGLAAVSVQADEFTEADLKKWKQEFMTVVEAGDKLFHSGEIGGNGISGNGVACAQCHPNATNNHPETYPKFQKQIGEVATLRDMINWCIENPLEGKPLALDDPRMLQLEAYVTWERRGVKLEPGKH